MFGNHHQGPFKVADLPRITRPRRVFKFVTALMDFLNEDGTDEKAQQNLGDPEAQVIRARLEEELARINAERTMKLVAATLEAALGVPVVIELAKPPGDPS
jgi:hypothetical protein